MAPEPEETPIATEPEVPIVKESLTQENMAQGTETTPPSANPKVVTPTTTMITS